MELKGLSPTQIELVESLQAVGLADDEIKKSLNIAEEDIKPETKENDIEKSIEDQIAEKQEEIDRLNQLQDLEKSEKDNLFGQQVDTDKIIKSVTAGFEKSHNETKETIDGLANLVKSLTDKLVEFKGDNETLTKANETALNDNDELKKSLAGIEDVMTRIAEQTPGLRSANKYINPINRFEKSETGNDGKEVMSISKQKDEISSKLAEKLDDEGFRKSLGKDVENFECSGLVSPQLEKALQDDLNIRIVQ